MFLVDEEIIRPFLGHDFAPSALRRGVRRRCRQTVPVPSGLPSYFGGSRRHPGTVGGTRKRRIRSRIARNSRLGTATSAIWNRTYRACVTTLAPILISFSRSVVSDQCFTDRGIAPDKKKPLLTGAAEAAPAAAPAAAPVDAATLRGLSTEEKNEISRDPAVRAVTTLFDGQIEEISRNPVEAQPPDNADSGEET